MFIGHWDLTITISLRTMKYKDVNNEAHIPSAVSFNNHADGIYFGTRSRPAIIVTHCRVYRLSCERMCIPKDEVRSSATGPEIANTEVSWARRSS